MKGGLGRSGMKGGIDGVHQLAAVDEHREVGASARACVELTLTLPGDRRDNNDAGAALDHFQAFFRRAVGGRGDDDVVGTCAVKDRLADSGECKPPRAFELADQCVAQSGVGRDDPDGLTIHRNKFRGGRGNARWPNGTGMRGSMGREMRTWVVGG